MADEGAPQVDRVLRHLPSVLGCAGGTRGARSLQPDARPWAPLQDGSRNGARHCARGKRPAQPQSAGPASSRRSQRIWDIPYSSEKWVGSTGEDRYRRGLYTFIRRSAAYELHDVRCNEPGILCGPSRPNRYAAQALTTLNDEAFSEAAGALAARLLKEAPRPDDNRAAGFRLAVTRTPAPAEAARDRFVQQPALAFSSRSSAAAVVIKGYAVAGIDPAEQAAWTLVANALLNLDEALTKD